MKSIHSMIAVLGLAFVPTPPADAATTDPEVIIYRFPGVRDTGGAPGSGVTTSFHCTNFSGVAETLRFVTRDTNSTLVSNNTYTFTHLRTITVSTRINAAYLHDFNIPVLSPMGFFAQGTVAIAATSTSIVCTAMTIDASTAAPVGVALRGIRFNPAPGSQE